MWQYSALHRSSHVRFGVCKLWAGASKSLQNRRRQLLFRVYDSAGESEQTDMTIGGCDGRENIFEMV